jgi:hypothetical protein
MSNFVYGYLKTFEPDVQLFDKLRNFSKEYLIGIKSINVSELYGFPEGLKPSEEEENVYCIDITDGPEKSSAEFLVDFVDYAEEADLELPKKGLDRLKIVLKLIKHILNLTNTEKFVIAMTESNEIESTQKVRLDKIDDVIVSDFIEYPPPNKIYIIDKIR